MCGVEQEIFEEGQAEGRAEGEAKGIEKSIKNLVSNLNMTVDEAMKALSIPESDRAFYASKIELAE